MGKNDEDTNPLLLDVVLDNIFPALSLKDLLTCRSVCKTWCMNATLKVKIRDRSIVNVRDIFLQTSTTCENLPDYFQLTGPIYVNYNLENISFNHTLVTKIFSVLGPSIKILRLHLNLHRMNADQFRKLLYELLPNLEVLYVFNLSHEEIYSKPLFPKDFNPDGNKLPKMNLKRLELQEIRFPIPEFMTEFLQSMPQIREIILKTEVCSDWPNQAEMWRKNSALAISVIKGLEGSGVYKSLKEFRCGKLRTDLLQLLVKMGEEGLELEIFEMHAPTKECEDLFNRFLETQKYSLKQLVLFEQRSYLHGKRPGDPERVFMLKLPEVMPNLEVLQFSKYQKAVMVPCYPIDYTRQCPQLRKLILLGYDYGESPTGNLYIPEVGSKTVGEVVLWASFNQQCQHEQYSDLSQMLSVSFVNLTKLTVTRPTKDFLKSLWGHCEKLKKLTLTLQESEYMDEAMTGIPESQIEKWFLHPEKIRSFSPDTKWTIMNLKDLQNLEITIDHDEESERQSLCDATAYFALGSMKQLRQMKLFSSDWRIGLTECLFFSKKCQHQLKQVLKFTVIYFEPPISE